MPTFCDSHDGQEENIVGQRVARAIEIWRGTSRPLPYYDPAFNTAQDTALQAHVPKGAAAGAGFKMPCKCR